MTRTPPQSGDELARPRTSQRRRWNTGGERRLLESRALEQFGEVLIGDIADLFDQKRQRSRDRQLAIERRLARPYVRAPSSARRLPADRLQGGIIRAFADGFADKPDTTFGTMNADVLAEKLPGYVRPNFCAIIRGSKHSS